MVQSCTLAMPRRQRGCKAVYTLECWPNRLLGPVQLGVCKIELRFTLSPFRHGLTKLLMLSLDAESGVHVGLA